MNKKIEKLIEIFYYYKPHKGIKKELHLTTEPVFDRNHIPPHCIQYYLVSRFKNKKGEVLFETKKALR